ncbi:Glutathione transferase [Ascochyta rabiei]|uniref:Transferase n=1 Tax=Didymella rabiei TaxID=5454 RepID=A0A163MG88_DIDRA|nr:Glutathione transferase [Ascochyta rabiei]KZM28689.1 transferase [Ascochyta rabiei]UPX19657.1 Glutathione transferase [Ascochyta rabiei]
MATESYDDPVEYEIERQNEKLKTLSSPSVIQDLTDDQAGRIADQRGARHLFNKFLSAYRQRAILLREEICAVDSDDESLSGSQTHNVFRFLDLPVELRIMVYEIHCAEYRRAYRISEEYYRKKIGGIQGPLYKRRSENKEACFQIETRRIGTQIWSDIIKPEQAWNTITEPYEEYEIQHQYQGSCRYNHERHFYVSIVSVNARGNLCENLPPLLLVSRQLFSEAWVSNFSVRPGYLRFKVKIRNFSVFPFLRLAQLLQRRDIPIDGNMVQIQLDNRRDDDRCYKKNEVENKVGEVAEKGYEVCSSNRYAVRSRRLSRLFELHWLQGVPLWNCFTNTSCDRFERDDDSITFRTWLYSIRQIVALHRIDTSKWRDLSTQLLRRHDELHKDEFLWPLSDSSMIEAVVGVFNEALKYQIGRTGYYAQGRYGDAVAKQKPPAVRESKEAHYESRYAPDDGVTTEREHAIVHNVTLYRVKINEAIRLELADVYEEWELGEDEKKIPEDVIF